MKTISVNNAYDLLPGIEPVLYGTSLYHRMLWYDDNIGKDGENLTIMVLSCERAQATIEMMESIVKQIPNFKGKFLVADNGSSQETKDLLKETFKKMPYDCKMMEYGENLGVAKGRNKAVEQVETEWIMSLDNDILFSENILPEVKNTISQYGTHFVNLPLLNETGEKVYSLGGNIFVEAIENGIHIGCGGSFVPGDFDQVEKPNPSFSTFLFGGASVFKKSTFEKCGKFDEGMFVGFEDIDFSIALFQAGYKIVTIGKLGLIHNHKKPQTQSDLEYERQRFSNTRLLESAKYFEGKHGFKIWNDATEAWLKEKEESLGFTQKEKTKQETPKPIKKEKKKLKVIIDSINSKKDKEFEQIREKLEESFWIDVIYRNELKEPTMSLLFAIQKADLVYFLDTDCLGEARQEEVERYAKQYGLDPVWLVNRYAGEPKLLAKREGFTLLANPIKPCPLTEKDLEKQL